MADVLNLEKGGSPVNVSDQFPNLANSAIIGLGWDPAEGKTADLDSSILLLDENKNKIDVIYFNHKEFKNGEEIVIKHNGDDLTGGSSDTGPDETINIKLNKLPENVKHVIPFMNIFDAESKGQKFGDIEHSFMVLIDGATEKEVIRQELKKEYQDNTGVVMADIYRFGGEWKVKTIEKGVNGDINTIVAQIPGMLE